MSRGPRQVVDGLFRGGRITAPDRDILIRTLDHRDHLLELLGGLKLALGDVPALGAELAGLRRDLVRVAPGGQANGEGAQMVAAAAVSIASHDANLEAPRAPRDCNRGS